MEVLVPGSADTELVRGIPLLHPQEMTFEAMLSGWGNQQVGGRRLQAATVVSRVRAVRRLVTFTGQYPWQWTAADMDEWSTSLVAERGLATSTIRFNQSAVRLFCDFVTSPHYQWPQECVSRFGTHPVQICYEWNTLSHLVDYEGRAERRPLTRAEVQALLDYADDRVDAAMSSGRKGALAAYRDATVFKVIYGWGLRCNEASRLELVDFHRNPHAPELGECGQLQVRWGKRTRGSAPRRRTVASLMAWAVEAVQDYMTNVRPRFGFEEHAGLWVTERGGRLKVRDIEARFAAYRDALGMPAELTPHCLRHSYVTHLVEDGVDPKFIQEQVGHVYAATTQLYTGVSGDFMNTLLRQALDKTVRFDQGDQ